MWFSDAGTIRTDHYLFYPCLKSFINFSLFNGSSRLRDLPPQTLTEPYVRLSPHTALHVPCKLPSLRKSLVLPISGWPKFYFGHVSPFAPFPLQKLHHYYELIRPCALHWYSRLVGFPLELLPYHQNNRFSCSVLKLVLGSCPLYAGCRFACYASSHQSSSQTHPRSLVLTAPNMFRHLKGFTCVHLLNTRQTVLRRPFPQSLTTSALNKSRIGWFSSDF